MKEENDIVKAITQEKQEKKKMSGEILNQTNKKIFTNILIAIAVMVFFCFVNLGFKNIQEDIFLTDLKVFSMSILILTITLFEISYKKDSRNALYLWN